MQRRSALISLAILLAFPAAALSQGNGNGNGNGNSGNNGNGNGNSGNNGNGNGNSGNNGNGNSSGNGNSNGNGNNGNGNGASSGNEVTSGNGGSNSSSGAATTELSEETALQAVESGEVVPLRNILPDLTERTGGEVINAHLVWDGNRLLYAVKVITPQGKVETEYYLARTGAHVER